MKRIVCEAVAVVGTALLLGSIVVAARQDPATASAPREIEVVASDSHSSLRASKRPKANGFDCSFARLMACTGSRSGATT